jgi:ribosomal protein S24E
MSHKIIKHFKNDLLGREEYVLEIISGKNPTKLEVLEILKADEGLCIIKQIRGGFGRSNFLVEATVYGKKEDKDKIEKITRRARKKIADEKKKADEAAKAEVKK